MRILGIDYGPTDAHCVLLDGEEFTLAFTVKMESTQPHHQQQFAKDFSAIAEDLNIDAIWIEDARFSQKMLRIQALLIASVPYHQVHLVNVSTWRSTIFDKTRVTKKETIKFVSQKGWVPAHHHYADAYCVALYGAQSEEQ